MRAGFQDSTGLVCLRPGADQHWGAAATGSTLLLAASLLVSGPPITGGLSAILLLVSSLLFVRLIARSLGFSRLL